MINKLVYESINSKPKRYRVEGYIINKNKLIVGYVNNPQFTGYVIPGGGIDNNEDNITALEREIKEEIAVQIKNPKLLDSIFLKYYEIPNMTKSAQYYANNFSGVDFKSYLCEFDGLLKNKSEFSIKEVSFNDVISFFNKHAKNCLSRKDKYNYNKAIYSIECIKKIIN